jgi:hypothetical protein
MATALAGVLVFALVAVELGLGGAPRALGQAPPGEDAVQADAAIPAQEVTMLGASPGEAPDETWGIGKRTDSSSEWVIVRYTTEGGWTLAPPIQNGAGEPLSGFVPNQSSAGELAGPITSNGSGALLGGVTEAGKEQQMLLVRDPGGAFTETSTPPPLEPGESLFAKQQRAPMVAALEEGSDAGALVVPVQASSTAAETRVLHWSDASHAWSVEPIELPQASKEAGGFRVLAIAASSPGNAWLLAQLQAGSDSVGLFHREEAGGGGVWQPVSPGPGEPAGAPLQVPLATGSTLFTVTGIAEPPANTAQSLTVSSQGVWIDGKRADTSTAATMFFKPEGTNAGRVLASWCVAAGECTHQLPESLPIGPYRSFAWANGSTPYGERVITGLPEGITLRLEGEEFKPVLSLGSSPHASVGDVRGAAFSSATEGWLGRMRLPPEHLTLTPEPNLLQNYPVPFSHPLLAIAPQPGAPAGALSSQALAVGEDGEVARYSPGAGWHPESLLSAGGTRATPPLRAVAWPTPSRAYAVGGAGPRTNSATNGQSQQQMWLWREETGLWEVDPATPINFTKNLLGIAFDPQEPSRGYAVGQSGALLRYGKTWTQEPLCEAGVPQPCLPPELANATFTSVAFAGSEALVAYRVPPASTLSVTKEGERHYKGGVLIDNGSGWQIDPGAAAVLGAENEDLPWAVAGLPDGGAAISAENANTNEPHVFERNAPGSPWEAAPAFPGVKAAGSLALFREGGALRAIASGTAPETSNVDKENSVPTPVGTPPRLAEEYPLPKPPAYLLRQTGGGWVEEEHDHDAVGPPEGSYSDYDQGLEPDPTWAVLVDPTGSVGWAVGGFPPQTSSGVGAAAAFQTADVSRYSYPAPEALTPSGEERQAIKTEPEQAVFAIGGGSQCAAPCAARAKADVGPDAWLSSALARAREIHGMRAFLYTGPRVTSGRTSAPATVPIPYEAEFERYAEVLGASAGMPTFVAASPTDRIGGNECRFEKQLPAYGRFGGEPACDTAGTAYYEVQTTSAEAGAPVAVLMLDDSGTIEAGQLAWLAERLASAEASREAAIVVGSANLVAEDQHGEDNAAQAVEVLEQGHASAYFFDAPEQNLHLLLPRSTIPAYGSGTLGYVNVLNAASQEFIGASGFLLVQVGAYEAASRRAPVTVQLIPDIGEDELSLEAVQGTLLRRSQAALFTGLARRPRAGNEQPELSEAAGLSYVYTPIPANCVGADCPPGGDGITPEYSFTSSNETVAKFVKQDLQATVPEVQFNAEEKPEFEEAKTAEEKLKKTPIHSKSGLLCALNHGVTKITIEAGGFKAVLPVEVEEGSVRQPCGTVPAEKPPVQEQQVPPPAPAPAPTPAPAPATAPPPVLLPPPPPPASPPPPTLLRAHPQPAPPFFLQPLPPVLLPAIVPPPLPAPANPTPPSGTSAVTSPVEAAQKEEEQEEATESVSNQAVAYRAPDHEPAPEYLLGLLVLAAFAGAAGARRRPRRRGREVRVAPATISSIRSQRRLDERDRRR